MNNEHEHKVIKERPATGTAFFKNILAGLVKFPGAIAHLITGPPMTYQWRFKQSVAEARATIDWLGLR